MSTPRDPIERLRRANPVPGDQAPSPLSTKARALFERIVDSPPEIPVRSRRRRGLWIVIPAVVLLVGAATYGIFRDVTETASVVCFGQIQLDGPREVVSASTRGPVAACQDLWAPGGEFNPSGGASPPPLEACVLPDGTAGVFPSLNAVGACRTLGLPAVARQGGRQQENQAISRVQDELANRFLSSCVGRQDATAYAEQALARNGLGDWRVVVPQPFTKREPCASLAVDASTKTIELVPVGPPAS